MVYQPLVSNEVVVKLTYKIDLTLSADKRWVKVGEPVTFTARLTKDGAGYAWQTLYLELFDSASGMWLVYETMPSTDLDGYSSMGLALGFDRACQDIRWRVRFTNSTGSYYSQEVQVAVAYPTRLTLSAPDAVASGQPFTVSGKLEYEKTSGNWVGLAGATVKIYADSTLLASPTTGSDGGFSASVTLTQSKTIKAVFEGLNLPSALAFYASAESQDIYAILGALSPLLAVGGVIAAQSLKLY